MAEDMAEEKKGFRWWGWAFIAAVILSWFMIIGMYVSAQWAIKSLWSLTHWY